MTEQFKIISAAVLVLLLALSAGTVFAKDAAMGSISGRIVGKNGESMAGGKIFLFRVDGGPPPPNALTGARRMRLPIWMLPVASMSPLRKASITSPP